MPAPAPRAPSPVGALLQRWRRVRRLSQLDLATHAEISPRHLCFVETGRAKPSREMVLLLADALDVPLRERNALLLAAGFAPMFEERPLDAPALATVRLALDAILDKHEPLPAVVMNRGWDIVRANHAATRFFAHLLDGATPPGPANVIRMMFDPAALRPRVRNWSAVAVALLHRMRRETVGGAPDARVDELLAEVSRYPGVRELARQVQAEQPSMPVIPVVFASGDGSELSFFSTVTTLGTAQDITVQELRIECFFPVDAATAEHVTALAPPR